MYHNLVPSAQFQALSTWVSLGQPAPPDHAHGCGPLSHEIAYRAAEYPAPKVEELLQFEFVNLQLQRTAVDDTESTGTLRN